MPAAFNLACLGPGGKSSNSTNSHNNLGISAKRFPTAFLSPTKCLQLINSILNELTSIDRVSWGQLQVGKKLNSGPGAS